MEVAVVPSSAPLKRAKKRVRRPADSTTSADTPDPSRKPFPFVRSLVVPPVLPGDDPLRYCKELMKELFSEKYHDIAHPFYKPVDVVGMGLHNYYDVIRYPIDLGTISAALDAGQYRNAHEFAADVRLIFGNCYRYNEPDHEIIGMAKELQVG